MALQDTRQSLLQEAQGGNDRAWQRLMDLYRPWITSWAKKHLAVEQDAEDLTQEIFLRVFRSLSHFVHDGRRGAFRRWLRTITGHAAHDFWSARHGEPRGSGDSAVLVLLQQLEDPTSELARTWDRQHDQFVLNRLLDQVAVEFEPKTMQAFRRQALDGLAAEVVAGELNMNLSAVYVAKSRVLKRLQKLSEGLLDWSGETSC